MTIEYDFEKIAKLVRDAYRILSNDQGKESVWRAYVSLERAILHLKLKDESLEHLETPPPLKQRRNRTRGNPGKNYVSKSGYEAGLAADAATQLEKLDDLLSSHPVKINNRDLLYDLRVSRDILKALMASATRS